MGTVITGMYEVEQKAPTDLDPVRTRLEAMDATFERTIEQQDTYFQHPIRDFAATDEALRLREITVLAGDGTNETVLTYKGPRLDQEAKTRREYETPIADIDTLAEILEALGFSPVATVVKQRERWRVDPLLVCLDTVDEVGTFIEVETTSNTAAVETDAKRARDLLQDLGVDPQTTITDSYLGLLLDPDD